MEYFGGALDVLNYPMHGKPSIIDRITNIDLKYDILDGLPLEFQVARFHLLNLLMYYLRVICIIEGIIRCMPLQIGFQTNCK